jgi:hypothetical protein
MDENINMSGFPIAYSEAWKLSEGSDKNGKRFIRLPVAVLGEWTHPEYGPVKFTQDDFDQMNSNWVKGVTGYEPPLYLGHNISKDVLEGEPAVAFLEKLYQEGDTLFAEYDPVDDDAYEKARKGQYRYSSAEVVRNATSKETGEKIGTLLVGAALTNRPFLTRMPRVEAGVQQFSESEGSASTLVAISVYPDPAYQPMDQVTEVETPATTLSPEMVEQFADLAKSVETLRAELDQTKQQLSEAQSQLKAQNLEKVLAEVGALNLTAAVKDKYSEMLRKEKLSESQQSEVMSLLRDLSEENAQVFAERRGQHEADPEKTAETKVEVINPYEAIINENIKLAEARKNQALNLV